MLDVVSELVANGEIEAGLTANSLLPAEPGVHTVGPIGRPLMAPPGTPPERVAQLRSAFDATVKDPAFLQEAAALGFEVMPQGGAEIAARVAAAMATPRDIVDEAQRASTAE
jgi:tripartite-type tricarboxylate transporter receptor subunit TctC